jgi:putative addiction module component (TIGR02574 family)
MENLEALAQQLLALPIDQRAHLTERLLESLDNLSEAENEKLWADEAVRRVDAFEAGEIDAIAAEDVHADMLLRIK